MPSLYAGNRQCNFKDNPDLREPQVALVVSDGNHITIGVRHADILGADAVTKMAGLAVSFSAGERLVPDARVPLAARDGQRGLFPI
jgi:hypothetical protein